ncbi:MAG: thioredoxin fold domain-containing protein [Gammaproteobacteria bacterium]
MVQKRWWMAVAAVLLAVMQVSVSAAAGKQAKSDEGGIFATLSKLSWAQQGHGPRLMYIFIDPNCPYCHELYTELQSKIGPEHLTVRWVPLGILTTTSAGKAASIVGAKDRAAALKLNETHYQRGQGGGIEEALPDQHVTDLLKANEHAWSQTGATGVPTIIFRNQSGRPTLVQGGPSPAELKELLTHVH